MTSPGCSSLCKGESVPNLASIMSDCSSKSGEGSVEMKDQAHRLCRQFLSGTWSQISSSDMLFQEISGGMSNFLYHCSLPETHTPLSEEPGQVLLRLYGQIHDGQSDATITESVIFMLLSERNLGPKLYGVFPEGRLEEYISARTLTCQELRNSEISATIARKLAMVHSLDVPISKEPTWLFSTMSRWLEFARKSLSLRNICNDKRALANQLLSANFEGELEWLKGFLSQVNSPVLFCHNDLQEFNILLPDSQHSKEDRMVFIDFEYCSYNYRGFDIANHFCEWTYDYSNPEFPYFTSYQESFPSQQQQLNFIQTYLKNLSPQVKSQRISSHTEDNILREVQAFVLASHLLWSLWCIYNGYTSKIKFGYWEYGVERLEAYYKWKAKFFARNNGHEITKNY